MKRSCAEADPKPDHEIAQANAKASVATYLMADKFYRLGAADVRLSPEAASKRWTNAGSIPILSE